MTLINEELVTPGDPNSLIVRQEYEQGGASVQVRIIRPESDDSARWFRAQVNHLPLTVEESQEMQAYFVAHEAGGDRPAWLLGTIYEDIVSEPQVSSRTVIHREYGVETPDGWTIFISAIGGDLGIRFYAHVDHKPITWDETVKMARDVQDWYAGRIDKKPLWLADELSREELMIAIYGKIVNL